MYYWVTDLRSGMIDNVPTCPSPRSYTCTDPANWQHVNFAAIALGTAPGPFSRLITFAAAH